MKYQSKNVVNSAALIKGLKHLLDPKLHRKLAILQIINSCSTTISTANIHRRIQAMSIGEACGIRCIQKDLEFLLFADVGISRHGSKGEWFRSKDVRDDRFVLITEELAVHLIAGSGTPSLELKSEIQELSAIIKSVEAIVKPILTTDGMEMAA